MRGRRWRPASIGLIALLAAHLRRQAGTEERIARVLAEREGLDVDADPRPRLAVAVFGGVMRVTERQWSMGEDFSLGASGN